MPEPSSELCPQLKNFASEITAGEMVQEGVDAAKNAICEGVDDANDDTTTDDTTIDDTTTDDTTKDDTTKDDTTKDDDAKDVEDETKDSGFQTNFLSVGLIALC